MAIMRFIILGCASALTIGCATGHCYGRNGEGTKKIFVFKPDGSKQCDKESGIKVEEMANELRTIKVFSQENKSDGLNHIMMCGSATGRINVYQILEKDLPVATAAGFKKLDE